MSAIRTAIVLAAGEGSRLRPVSALKPLCAVAGRTLIARAIDGLVTAGVTRIVCVLGYEADRIEAALDGMDWPASIEFVRTADYRLANGVSVLAARAAVGDEPCLLVMCDHLVDPALYALVARAGPGPGLRLGVDRRLDNRWVDPDDVTRVRTAGEAIVAIGKGLDPYDCFDTGVFAISGRLFEALAELPAPSLSDGVRLMAQRGETAVLDCGELDWIDVDDATAFGQAEQWIAAQAA